MEILRRVLLVLMITLNQPVTLIKTFPVRKNAQLCSPAKLGADIYLIFLSRMTWSAGRGYRSHFIKKAYLYFSLHAFNFLTQRKVLSFKWLKDGCSQNDKKEIDIPVQAHRTVPVVSHWFQPVGLMITSQDLRMSNPWWIICQSCVMKQKLVSVKVSQSAM